MGILNVTPDSFSDGGRFAGHAAAVAHAHAMVAAGADVIDVGGESTRPGAKAVPVQQELDRVIPVIEALARGGEGRPKLPVPLSIDTRKPPVARAAIAAGAGMINDISATRDTGMVDVLREHADVSVVLMHMQGDPRTMQEAPRYDDVVSEVAAFLEERLSQAVAAGVREERVCLDPGFGFGKTADQNLELLRNLDRIVALGRPVMVGISRKWTLARVVSGLDARVGTDAASVGAAVAAFDRGATLFRVHEVRSHVEALAVAAAVERGAVAT
jgi:dihydropteroate synthase